MSSVNSEERLNAAIKYREEAIADGWECKATYNTEPMESASSLSKDGFNMMILTRHTKPPMNKFKYKVDISIWGPDGLAIKPPEFYNMSKIMDGLKHCNACNKNGVDTQRVGFAGRCCTECLPAMRQKHEYPNWTN